MIGRRKEIICADLDLGDRIADSQLAASLC